MIDIASIDADTRALLDRYGFDAIPLDKLALDLKSHGVRNNLDRIAESIEPAHHGMLFPLPAAGSQDEERLCAIGQRAIDAGQVGVVVLNGGMATRFGGTPKCVVPAVDGRSFLDLKLSQAAKAGSGRSPIMLMNSFATEEATAAHLKEIDLSCEVQMFNQMISLRLTLEGDLFIRSDGRPSPHTTGHGDLPFALRSSGLLERFTKAGGRWLVVSNVDNLGAGLSPVVLGAHIDRKNPMSVEVVKARIGDVGGFPALVAGKMKIVEMFRAPRTPDLNLISFFNTNTFIFNAEALAAEVNLDWFPVLKTVEGSETVQFERLVGQLADFFEVSWLLVPREGPRSRFIPVKVQADLDGQIATLREVLEREGIVERSI